MTVATVATGLAAGVLGAALTLLLHALQHLLFGYTEGNFLIGVEHAGPARRVLALAGTGVVVGAAWWLTRQIFSRESVSVVGTLRRPRPQLPVVATLVDAVVQIAAVAGGASLGREGAPRQAGALAGGQLAQRLGLDADQQRVLLACGAGAGLAAVYDVPLGGAAFALEVLLATLGLRALVPALVTSGLAALVGQVVLRDGPTYRVPHLDFSGRLLAWAPLLGAVAGVLGVAFTRLMTFAREHAPTGWRVAVAVPVAFAAVGALAVAYPQLPGNGKGPAGLAFDATIGLGLATVLLVLKPLVTAACLGAGAIGGVLTPALATGALLGAVAAQVTERVWPGEPAVAFAVVGAAAVLAVTQRAPVTAVLLTLELVGGGYAPHGALVLIVPMAVAVAVAAVVGAVLGERGALVSATAAVLHCDADPVGPSRHAGPESRTSGPTAGERGRT
ncbi:chloride channel protein [uncultured Jatrophihabitans sp.]|uniref:chloride channel protein n=1 Tax=uncultured Jatrophihabitans sp. TaxID=1610747 RepID=UPI0035CC779C